MKRHQIPLNAIRAFEVAARLGSFARAARELNITPAAVSQQVRHLEEQTGIELFVRHARGLSLTTTGAAYASSLSAILDQLATATDRAIASERGGILTISTTPSFAAKWLVPRLIRFQDQYPELDVRLSTSNDLVNFTRQEVDVAIRYGRGNWDGLEIQALMSTQLFPVCSPALLEGAVPLRVPDDLRHHTRLRLVVDEWPKWLEAAGVTEFEDKRSASYSDAGLLIQAAIEGHGVALGQRVLVTDDLDSGRLIEPFDLRISSGLSYYVVSLPGGMQRPKVRDFCNWLFKEVGPPSAAKT